MSAPRSFTKRCVALILIATLSIGAVSASVNPVLVLYLRQYQQFTGRELTVALTGFNVAGMVVSLALGRWVDISGRGIQTFLGVSAASAVCYMMLPLTHSYPTTLAVLLTAGGPSLALISLLFTLLRRAGLGDRILMYARAAFSLSWVIGPAVSPFIIQTLGYPALFWFAAALCVTGSVALIAPLYLAASSPAAPPWRVAPAPATPSEPALTSVNARSPLLVSVLVTGFVALQAVNAVSVAYLAVLVVTVRHLPLSFSGTALGVCAGLEVVFLVLLGRYHALSHAKPAIVFIGGCAALVYVAALPLAHNPWALMLLQIPNALFVATVLGVGMTWFQDLSSGPAGLMTAVYMNTSRLGAIISAPILGLTGILPLQINALIAALGLSCIASAWRLTGSSGTVRNLV